MSGSARVIYIHGNGNKIAAPDLKYKWDRALFGKDAGDLTSMAYFADLRYGQPLPNVGSDVESGLAGVLESVPEETEPREQFVASVLGDLEMPDEETAAAFKSWAERAVEEGDAAAERPPSNLEVFGFLPQEKRRWLMRQVLRVTFKDVHAYFFEGDEEGINQRLRDELSKGGDPLVIIAHSLGSIVAYQVLREDEWCDTPVDLFLTVGSPLGIREVQDFLVPPREWPVQVREWINLADPFDVVALDKGLRNDFSPKGRIQDHLVDNDTPNHHGIIGYLSLAKAQVPVRERVL